MGYKSTIHISRAAALGLYIEKVLGCPAITDETLATFMDQLFEDTTYNVLIAGPDDKADDDLLHLVADKPTSVSRESGEAACVCAASEAETTEVEG